MKIFLILTALLLTTHSFARACSDVSEFKTHTIGNPVLKVSPKYPDSLSSSMPSGCAIVEYRLIEKPSSNGKALIPADIVIIESSQNAFGLELQKAVEKWLFFTKTHPDYQSLVFIAKFDFVVE
ncbi:hypothetical protein [Alteromonas sp. KUL49]|uniref:hypothetical protein n=1 Tax=Alteromonas sp. KUL49 TaxID=2480798 RepID=UPI00102EE158|nr:hypothetical protein [Alteromonas sp. KUL49]TAP41301.1 hypothetical protein EYS00_03665 [Alteromonas sp. KUL49]GEA10361.1 hypothetical protein KUL49_07360 [Alteromonas sp. KUL49]